MSNLRPLKRIDLLLRAFASARERDRMRLVILAGGSFGPYEALRDELGLREQVIVTENGATIEDYLRRPTRDFTHLRVKASASAFSRHCILGNRLSLFALAEFQKSSAIAHSCMTSAIYRAGASLDRWCAPQR